MSVFSIINNIDSPNQILKVVLPVDGKNLALNIHLRWSNKRNRWYMSVLDDRENVLVHNIPLIASVSYPSANLLRQVGYKRIGSAAIYTLVEHPSTVDPGFDNFGIGKEFVLVWGDTLDE